jgi:hypothetical protein
MDCFAALAMTVLQLQTRFRIPAALIARALHQHRPSSKTEGASNVEIDLPVGQQLQNG